MLSAYGPEYVIQVFYKYKPASYRALALLVYADGKDRMTLRYMADMLRAVACRPQFLPPSLHEILNAKPIAVDQAKTQKKAETFVDELLRRFKKEAKNETGNP